MFFISALVLLLSSLQLIQAQPFCEPAEAHLIEIRLRETEPSNEGTCAALDAMFGFSDMIAEVILPAGSVIPANCTINRLIDYSCRERFGFCKSNTRRSKSHSKSNSKRSKSRSKSKNKAKISIRTLILCNACMVVPAGLVEVPKPVYSSGIIDADELQPMLGIGGGLEFTVQAFERTTKRKKHSHSKSNTYRKGCFLCGDNFVYPFDKVQCDCPTECP